MPSRIFRARHARASSNRYAAADCTYGLRRRAARRIDASSPEDVLLGGLTVDPRYRGRDLAEDVRRACIADLGRQGVAHCSLAHVDNERVAMRREHRDFAPWLVANLGMPPAPPWKDFLRRVRARLSPEDRPVRRRRPEFTPR